MKSLLIAAFLVVSTNVFAMSHAEDVAFDTKKVKNIKVESPKSDALESVEEVKKLKNNPGEFKGEDARNMRPENRI